MKENDSVNQMNAYYDARAPWHDEYMSYRDNEAHETLLAPVIADFELLLKSRSVLEIACGTGNWTQVLAKRARSVWATDVNPSTLTIARTKPMFGGQVTFDECDAYSLTNLSEHFDIVFFADWFSHIPVERREDFLGTVNDRLNPGGQVIMIDMTATAHHLEGATRDARGNLSRIRTLPDGRQFPVVKNFPTESELTDLLSDSADSITYRGYPDLDRWMLIYQVKGTPA